MCLCDNCTAPCCRYVVVNIGKPSSDQRVWAEMRGTLDGQGNWRLPARCCYLASTGRCGIYAARPHVCRDYEPGGPMCMAARQSENIKEKLCPK